MIDQFDCDKYERPVAVEIFKCFNCSNSIYEGQYYWDLEQGTLCEECIDNMREVAENA